jgi:hypothetical protein
MKWVVFALLVLNFALLGFYLASSYMAEPQEASVAPPASPPYNGPIRLLSAQDLAALPKKTPDPAASAPVMRDIESCYEWGSFKPTDAARALAALKRLNLQATAQQLPKLASGRYWVYIPPLDSPAETQAKRKELRSLGVEETLIVQDVQLRNGISLGLFKEEALADKLIYKLHNLGVENVIKTKRGQGINETNYIIRHISPQQTLKLAELKPHFSASELNQIDCQ